MSFFSLFLRDGQVCADEPEGKGRKESQWVLHEVQDLLLQDQLVMFFLKLLIEYLSPCWFRVKMAIRDFPETTDEMVSRLVKLILCKWLELCFIKSILQGGFVAAKGVFFKNLVYPWPVQLELISFSVVRSDKKCGFSLATECRLFAGYPTPLPPQYCIRLAWQSTGTQSHSWVEWGTVIVKCFAQELNTMTRPGLEPAPLVPASRVTTIRPQQRLWKIFQMRTKLESFVWNVFSEYGSLFNEITDAKALRAIWYC